MVKIEFFKTAIVLIYSCIWSFKLYLLCHVGLRQIVEDESNLLLDILWRFYNPFSLVSGHQQGVDVGCVYRGLDLGLRNRLKSKLYVNITCRKTKNRQWKHRQWTRQRGPTHRGILLEAAGCRSSDGGGFSCCGCSRRGGDESAGLT